MQIGDAKVYVPRQIASSNEKDEFTTQTMRQKMKAALWGPVEIIRFKTALVNDSKSWLFNVIIH